MSQHRETLVSGAGVNPSATYSEAKVGRRVYAAPNPPRWAWATCGRGLSFIERGFLFRFVATILVVAVYVVGLYERHGVAIMAELLGYAYPFAVVVTGAFVAIGSLNFAIQPVASRGRLFARAAAFAFIGSAILDALILIKGFSFFGAGLEVAVFVVLSLVLGVVGLFTLLASVHHVALFFGNRGSARRAIYAAGLYLMSGCAVGVSLLDLVGSASSKRAGLGIAAALALAAFCFLLAAIRGLGTFIDRYAAGMHGGAHAR